MIIGVPTEVKNNEYRVSATPAGVAELVAEGHEVLVQAGAGRGSAFPDEEYGRPVRPSSRWRRRCGPGETSSSR